MIDIVTGGGGFIGSHLVDRLLESGSTVRVVDNFCTGQHANLAQHRGNPRLEITEADICDAQVMDKVLAGAERVFHLAARADIVPSIREPEAYWRSNVEGTFRVLEAARKHNIKRFVYVASSSCYGIPDSYPTPEDAPMRPEYPYALTKRLGEEAVLHWAKVYGLPAVSIRFFNIYGPRARTTGSYGAVFGVFLAQLLAGKELTVVGDGTQTRDFTYVSDAVAALVCAAQKGKAGEVYNVGTGNPVSVNRLVELLGAKGVVHLPKRPGEPDATHANISKIRTELGWEPEVSIEQGVKIMLENIAQFRDAPVWTKESIHEATRDWFAYLGPRAA